MINKCWFVFWIFLVVFIVGGIVVVVSFGFVLLLFFGGFNVVGYDFLFVVM